MMFLLMTKGDEGIEAQLKASIDNYNNAVASMAKYIAERDDAYNRMFLSKPTIDKYFPLIFPNSKVEFDNEYKTIEINTSRDLITYSEGEKHEMYSIIRELAIIGSYKELVIVDDPLTELDVANEYKNVFRFVRLASEKNKKVIVFTCNPDFINIVNEYHQSLFERYYLMSHRNLADETLTLKLLKMDFANNAKEPYISLKQAIGSDLTQVNNQVISLISERANLEILRNDVNRLGDIGKILHYDCCTNISIRGSTTFSNDQFVTSIDTFTKLPDYSSFSELARDRVYYLAALRVYLEKKIYDYQQERINRRLCNCFVPKSNGKPYLTKEKIEIVDKINDTFKITDKYSKWNKSILMCLKTMLNDNDHPCSQILPISYAISLSDDTLENEIILLKDMFS